MVHLWPDLKDIPRSQSGSHKTNNGPHESCSSQNLFSTFPLDVPWRLSKLCRWRRSCSDRIPCPKVPETSGTHHLPRSFQREAKSAQETKSKPNFPWGGKTQSSSKGSGSRKVADDRGEEGNKQQVKLMSSMSLQEVTDASLKGN